MSGNPVAVAAGLETLRILKTHKDEIYPAIEKKAAALEAAYKTAIEKYNVPATINRTGSLMSIFFTNQPVVSFDEAFASNLELFKNYFAGMLKQGIYIAPSQFEALFVGYAHTDEDISATVKAIDETLKNL